MRPDSHARGSPTSAATGRPPATAYARIGDRTAIAAEDVDRESRCAWWLGDTPASIATGEELVHRLEDAGRTREAAMAALRLGLQWALRGDEAIFAGWFAKARRLLAALPVGPEHGYLRYVTAMLATDTTGMPDDAEAAASELRGMERTYGSRALGAFALVLAAHAKILRGDADAGFDLLDEAMLPVMAGEVDPFWGGDIYCTVIHLTGLIGDFGRMRAWTDALDTWSAELSQTFSYAGIVRVHQLELLVAEGRWDEAAAELGPASSSIADTDTWVSGHGFAELGHVLRLRGRRGEAAEAYARALRAGVDPEPGPALLAAAEGRRSEGVDALRAAMAYRVPRCTGWHSCCLRSSSRSMPGSTRRRVGSPQNSQPTLTGSARGGRAGLGVACACAHRTARGPPCRGRRRCAGGRGPLPQPALPPVRARPGARGARAGGTEPGRRKPPPTPRRRSRSTAGSAPRPMPPGSRPPPAREGSVRSPRARRRSSPSCSAARATARSPTRSS